MLPDAEAEFSADEKEGYLIMESDALEDWNVNVTYKTQKADSEQKVEPELVKENLQSRDEAYIADRI